MSISEVARLPSGTQEALAKASEMDINTRRTHLLLANLLAQNAAIHHDPKSGRHPPSHLDFAPWLITEEERDEMKKAERVNFTRTIAGAAV